jgi:hypothetical protein
MVYATRCSAGILACALALYRESEYVSKVHQVEVV